MMTNGEDRSDAVLLDAVVVRPLTLASGIVGIGLWVVTLPFSLPGGSVEVAGKEFVGRPLEYTFTRPLGEWRFCGADRHPC